MDTSIKIELSDAQRDRLQARACELGLTPEVTVATFMEEGLRQRDFPGIHFRDTGSPETGILRQAFVPGLRVPVYFLAELAREVNGDVETIAEHYSISQSAVMTSLAYIRAYPDEIERDIAEHEKAEERLLAMLPSSQVVIVP